MRSVLIRTPLNTSSGYGNDGYGLAKALAEKGYDVHLLPMSVSPPIPLPVAQLLAKPPTPPFDLFINHCDPVNIGETNVDSGRQVQADVKIAWTMWEWDTYPHMEKLRDQISTFDGLASYDEVTARALQPALRDDQFNIQVQGGYVPTDWPNLSKQRDWDGPFRFCLVGQANPRKNPFVAVEAWQILKERHGDAFDSELHLKTTSLVFHPALEEHWPGLKIHLAAWPRQRLLEFYGQMHCLLAPSTGEGKNMPALEAMSTGIPTIATSWGGHTVWQDPAYSYGLDYELRFMEHGLCAFVDPHHMAEVMWEVYCNRTEAREKGALAARTIPNRCSWDAVTQRLLDQLRASGVTI